MQIKKRTYSQLDHADNDLCLSLSVTADCLYSRILRVFWFDIEKCDSINEGWIAGKIKAKKEDVIIKCRFARKTFYRNTWKELIDAGLIIEEKGYIILPRFMSKIANGNELNGFSGDDQAEQNKKEQESESRFERIEKNLEKLIDMVMSNALAGGSLASEPPHSEASPAQAQEEKENGVEMSPTGLARYFLERAEHKATPSALKNAEAEITDLLTEHDYDELYFCLKYLFENSPEKPRTFKYIRGGMSRALGAYEKERTRLEKQKELEYSKSKEREDYEESFARLEKLREIKSSMGDDDVSELRARALELAKEKGFSNAAFLTEPILEGLEIEILKGDGIYE